jgi:hypothetical protein
LNAIQALSQLSYDPIPITAKAVFALFRGGGQRLQGEKIIPPTNRLPALQLP